MSAEDSGYGARGETARRLATPMPVLLRGVGSVALGFCRERPTRYRTAALWLAILVPAVYIVAGRLPLHDGIRHLLFLYPPFVALAGATAATLWNVRSQFAGFAGHMVFLCLGAALIDPIAFSVRNHPNEGMYFNELEPVGHDRRSIAARMSSTRIVHAVAVDGAPLCWIIRAGGAR